MLKTRKQKMMERIHAYFMKNFKVDINEAHIIEYTFDDPAIRGEFVPERLEVRVADLMEELTIVHELTHYCQLIKNASLCIAEKIKDIKKFSEDEFENEKAAFEKYKEEVGADYEKAFNESDDDFEKMCIQSEYNELMGNYMYELYSDRAVEIDARISMCAYYFEQHGCLSAELIDILFCAGYSDRIIAAIKNTRHPVKAELLKFLDEEFGDKEPIEITDEFIWEEIL